VPPAPVTPADAGPVAAAADGSGTVVEREFTIRAMTSRELITRRFLRHRGALGGLLVFLTTLVLSFSSIGVAGIPGWWGLDYETPATVVNGGKMTLDVLPFIDGDGLAWGAHPFGQDDVGRDYFALTMRGTQISLMICLLVGLLATMIGVLVGAAAGFYRGKTEAVLMRITDVILTIPLLIIAAVLGRNVQNAGPMALAIMIGVLYWTTLARLVRGEFKTSRPRTFSSILTNSSPSANRRSVTWHRGCPK
jgi:peptide/nickel transport system permease protein